MPQPDYGVAGYPQGQGGLPYQPQPAPVGFGGMAAPTGAAPPPPVAMPGQVSHIGASTLVPLILLQAANTMLWLIPHYPTALDSLWYMHLLLLLSCSIQ